MKKLWIYQGGIILFAACMCIQAMTVYRYKTYVGTDEFYYQKYIDEFGNRINNFIVEKYGVLIDALFEGKSSQYIETEVRYEDGRIGKISADLKIEPAKVVAV